MSPKSATAGGRACCHSKIPERKEIRKMEREEWKKKREAYWKELDKKIGDKEILCATRDGVKIILTYRQLYEEIFYHAVESTKDVRLGVTGTGFPFVAYRDKRNGKMYVVTLRMAVNTRLSNIDFYDFLDYFAGPPSLAETLGSSD
jgi:hypothetical protein